MALATKQTVTHEQTVYVEAEEITLTLSTEEAEVLVKVTNNIGGIPDLGYARALTDGIGRALRLAGVEASQPATVSQPMILGGKVA